MSFFLIAGEPSGDSHAARLVAALRQRLPDARFAGMGGDAMRDEGVTLFQDYREMAFMGVVAVLRNLKKVRRNFSIAKEALLREKPDVLVLVDYPSFNLRIAQFARKNLPDTKVVWYIPPKVWAWKHWRVHRIARYSDAVLGIFPFETDFYLRYGYRCVYVGNPTVEECALVTQTPSPITGNCIALLPGSRRSEVEHCLAKMVAAARLAAPDYRLVIAGTTAVPQDLYSSLAPGVEVVFGRTTDLLAHASAAVVNSGTATLQAALLGCPQVAVYHIAMPHAINIAGLLFSNPVGEEKQPFFTLPDIILGKEVIPELIGSRFTVGRVAGALGQLLHDETCRNAQLEGYEAIRKTLGTQQASVAAAESIAYLVKN